MMDIEGVMLYFHSICV